MNPVTMTTMSCMRLLMVVAMFGFLASCEKARGLFGGGTGGGAVLGTVVVPPGGSAEASMDAMVTRTDEGVSFRRDIEFPSKIQGVLSVTRELQGVRVMEGSALGNESKTLSGSFETRMLFTKGAGQFTMTLERVEQAAVEAGKKPEVDATPLREKGREGKALYFGVSEEGWYFKAPEGTREPDLESWAAELGGEFPQLLVDAGAHPRVQWFSPARVWRSGDRIVLAGNAVKLLDPFDSGGRVVLVFEGEEPIAGHPCGVFAVEGSYTVKDRLTAYGGREEAEVTITKGRIWASLLFPMLLREEYEVVETLTRKLGSGPEFQMQGGVKITRARAWASMP